MKYQQIQDIPSFGKYPQPNSYRKTIFLILFFITLTTLPLYLRKITSLQSFPNVTPKKTCNVFNGSWVPHLDSEPYYTNETCNLMIDELNCVKFGRTDTDFLKWRWKPDECELPLFNATLFLNHVKGKSLAFLGDSVGRNQMFSLLCLLTQKGGGNDPEDVSPLNGTEGEYFKRYKFHDYNFTVGTLWAPFLVRSEESDPNGFSRNSLMNLYLDEPDPSWSTEVENFDYVVVSAGQWFFRQSFVFLNRTLAGCSFCQKQNTTANLLPHDTCRRAFRTVFQTLLGLENYRGMTFLRTFSPAHFENGNWNDGGRCERTKPFGRGEAAVPWYIEEMRRAQVEEFAEAKEAGEKKGLVFRVMDTTKAMYMRPDGHPNFYGRSPRRNMSYADCVHWCTPGPVDAWNEFLLYLLNQP